MNKARERNKARLKEIFPNHFHLFEFVGNWPKHGSDVFIVAEGQDAVVRMIVNAYSEFTRFSFSCSYGLDWKNSGCLRKAGLRSRSRIGVKSMRRHLDSLMGLMALEKLDKL